MIILKERKKKHINRALFQQNNLTIMVLVSRIINAFPILLM